MLKTPKNTGQALNTGLWFIIFLVMFKTIKNSLRQYKGITLATPIFISLEVVMEVLIPYILAFLIDKGIDAQDPSALLKYGAMLVGASILSLIGGVAAGYTASKASTGFASNLRHDLFSRIMGFSFQNVDKFSAPGLVTRMTSDITSVQQAFQMLIRIAIRAPFTLIFSLIMSFSVSKSISMLLLVAIPAIALPMYFISRKAFPIFSKMFEKTDKLNLKVQENLRGIRAVKAFVSEDREIKGFNETASDLAGQATKAESHVAFIGPIMNIVLYATMLLIAWLGARLIVAGSLTTGQLTSVLSYAMQILMSLMMLSMVLVMLTISQASFKRIAEVLNEKPTIEGSTCQQIQDGSIRLEDVDFSYSGEMDKLVLKDISLDIPSGCTVGILGGTGSGKTSLVSLIPRLFDATAGRVLVGGKDVKDYELKALRRSVAMVLQKNLLFSGTVAENLRWGNADATDEDLREACRLAQADGFVSAMPQGYETHIEQGGSNISGGQRQRLCIARAILSKPRILILDDSTSAVDTATDARIREGFKTLLPSTTKLIISQRILSVKDADLIILLDNGRILAKGTHDELLSSCPLYAELNESQAKTRDNDIDIITGGNL